MRYFSTYFSKSQGNINDHSVKTTLAAEVKIVATMIFSLFLSDSLNSSFFSRIDNKFCWNIMLFKSLARVK